MATDNDTRICHQRLEYVDTMERYSEEYESMEGIKGLTSTLN